MADESERNRLLSEFTGVTDTDAERAQFYLESSGWDLHIALSSFYDSIGEDIDSSVPEQSVKQPGERTRRAVRSERQIASMANVRSIQSDEDSDDEEGQAFYAGGSERSGQQILGPPRKKQPPHDVTQNIFDEAKRHGAEVVPDEDIAGPSSQERPAFTGAGYRLGDTTSVSSNPIPETASTPENNKDNKETEVALKFWSNGFSVDDGPLRSFEDPSNEHFLNSVKRGEIPRELLQRSRGKEVHVNLQDNRHQEYLPPAQPKVKAFSGAGHKLGSPVPQVKFANTSPSTTASVGTKPVASSVDETKPVTSIQIRLADGTRMVSKFNHTNTVGDIRSFIRASRPQMASQNFVLMTTFPNKELTDDRQTVAEANLLNAVIVQRFK